MLHGDLWRWLPLLYQQESPQLRPCEARMWVSGISKTWWICWMTKVGGHWDQWWMDGTCDGCWWLQGLVLEVPLSLLGGKWWPTILRLRAIHLQSICQHPLLTTTDCSNIQAVVFPASCNKRAPVKQKMRRPWARAWIAGDILRKHSKIACSEKILSVWSIWIYLNLFHTANTADFHPFFSNYEDLW